MVRQKVTIINPTGLHLRPAGIFCNIASSFKCKVTFEYDNTACLLYTSPSPRDA